MSTPEAAIVARNVTRRFGAVSALTGLNLTVPYGKVTALIGPNGAGKTTLLLILATLLTPDKGEVRVAGFDPVTKPRKVRARVGWMPDALGVYDQLTAVEYLMFFAAAHRVERATAASRAADLLSLVHLDDHAGSPVHVLSRGQKQRLTLARALIHQPKILLLDEPASGLDPRSRFELRDLLRGMAAEGAAVLVSSHILTELQEIADRMLFVANGRTVGEQDLAELAVDFQLGWRIRATDPVRLATALAERGIVTGQSTSAGTDLPTMTEEEAADLLEWLVSKDVRVIALGPTGSHLESAYLAMTEDRR